jgi:phage recombination protein Bet
MQHLELSEDKKDLLKRTICPAECTDDEFQLFLYQCKRTQLDPFIRQIYMIKNPRNSRVTFLVSIDGLRIIAERTGIYAPGSHADFCYDNNNKLVSATAYAFRKLNTGEWQAVSDIAYYDEYVQYNKDGKPNHIWNKMARTMLAKCAEAKLLRRICPCDLSNLYAEEEIDPHRFDDQKPSSALIPSNRKSLPAPSELVNEQQIRELVTYCEEVPGLEDLIVDRLKIDDFSQISLITYTKITDYAKRKVAEMQTKDHEADIPAVGQVLNNDSQKVD